MRVRKGPHHPPLGSHRSGVLASVPGLGPWFLQNSKICYQMIMHFREGNGNPLQYSCLENSLDREPGGLQSMGSQSTPSGVQSCVLTPDLVCGLAGWQGRLIGAQASLCWVLKVKATTDHISGSPVRLNQHNFTVADLQRGSINLLRCCRAHPPPASPHPTLCIEDRRKQTQ